jgi:hypothetical protein
MSRLSMQSRAIILLVLLMSLVSCAMPFQSGGDRSAELIPVFTMSELVVGENRIAIGLVRNGSPINDPSATVILRAFDLQGTTAEAQSEAVMTYYGQGLPAGIWVTYLTFDTPGNLGVEVEAKLPEQAEPSKRRYNLEIKSDSSAPRVGDHAMAVRTLTIRDVADPKELSSGPSPDAALYQISLDAALESGKPTAILFATPNFCQTATCGPSALVLSQLQQKYGDRMNMIHSEIYRYPFGESAKLHVESIASAQRAGLPIGPAERQVGYSDAMIAWDLPSEPWLFLIDSNGVIAARYEGGITQEELSPAIEQLLAGEPIVTSP